MRGEGEGCQKSVIVCEGGVRERGREGGREGGVREGKSEEGGGQVYMSYVRCVCVCVCTCLP